jgi:hypothetical protein
MGLRNTLVDIWLGVVEYFYVGEKAAPVVRRRRILAAQAIRPTWQEVLYSGAAATESGAHIVDSPGSFRILATPPVAPPQHNRRGTDRAPIDREVAVERRDRRASDRSAANRRS